jgi:hypothetical protein
MIGPEHRLSCPSIPASAATLASALQDTRGRSFCNATWVTGAQILEAIGRRVGYVRAARWYGSFNCCRAMESAVPAAPKPKLIDRVRQAIRLRHYSRRTEDSYARWVRRFILFHRKRRPAEMGGAEVTAFLTSLAIRERVSASTQNQALSALLFLYRDVLGIDLGAIPPVVRARTPERLPVVLSRDEIQEPGARHTAVTCERRTWPGANLSGF